MITMEHVCKSYKVAKRDAGFVEACKSLFHREYETVQALSDVSFTIGDGEMVGYIGPNGAGKSSTIKILSGILTPDSGTCLVNGRVPWKERIRHVREIGVVFGQRSQLWWDVPVIDSFELLKDIYSIPEEIYQKNKEELTERLALTDIIRMPARQLSLGQRMKCEIAASLLHNPRILFLDEPTIGLDAVSKLAVRDFVKRINKEKHTTVILTTHDMQDIEALTERVMLIGKGQILLDGSMSELKNRVSDTKKMIVKYKGNRPQIGERMRVDGEKENEIILSFRPAAISASDCITYLSKQVEIVDLQVLDISADEMVARLYEEYRI